MRKPRLHRFWWWLSVDGVVWGVFVLVLAGILGIAAAWGSWMHGDWKCGMPGVQCRKVTK